MTHSCRLLSPLVCIFVSVRLEVVSSLSTSIMWETGVYSFSVA